jgi:hypothetical protein
VSATATKSIKAAAGRLLHVANGTCTTALIERAGIGGTCSIWADPLHEGPVPGGLSDAQLIAVRASHIGAPRHEDAVLDELQRWRQAIDASDAYDELVLWFEHDLFDQLNLVQLLSYLAATRPVHWTAGAHRAGGTPRVTLVCIDSFPGRVAFKGLGELEPDDIGTLLEIRKDVTRAQYDLATAAWSAFRASSPTHLEEVLRLDTSALPYLSAALHRHLEEFPWTTDGLTRTERRLMTLARDAPIEIGAAFPRMHDDEKAFYITDGSFFAIVRELAAHPTPLVSILSEGGDDAVMRGSIALTPAGCSVLAGTADRIAVSGFDRWLGGVHVSPATGIWRWDPARSEVIAS